MGEYVDVDQNGNVINEEGSFKEFVKKVFKFLTHNRITVTKEGNVFANIPLLLALIFCGISVGIVFIVVFVSMMFGYKYSFNGEAKFDSANKAMDSVSRAAGHVKAEYDKL